MLKKIEEQDIESFGVVSAPDKLEGDPEANKKVFDRLVKEVVAQVVNSIIHAHNELCVDVDELAEQLKNHVDIDPNNLTAENIGLLRELADKYGLTDKLAPTVHDALEVLEQTVKYLDHWWVRRPGLSSVSEVWFSDPINVPALTTTAGRDYAFAVSKYDGGYPDTTIIYDDEVELDEHGAVHLKEPQTITTRPADFEKNVPIEILRGMYVQAYNDPSHIMRICEDASLRKTGGPGSTYATYYFAASTVLEVFGTVAERTWERVRSADRNAYPDEGEQDGMEYRYLGIPVDRLIDKMVEEATE